MGKGFGGLSRGVGEEGGREGEGGEVGRGSVPINSYVFVKVDEKNPSEFPNCPRQTIMQRQHLPPIMHPPWSHIRQSPNHFLSPLLLPQPLPHPLLQPSPSPPLKYPTHILKKKSSGARERITIRKMFPPPI